MRYIAAYLLAGLGSNTNPAAKDLEVILNSVGVEIDKDRLNMVINELKDKKIEDVLKEGMEKLSVASASIGCQRVESGPQVTENEEPASANTKEDPPKEETDESDDDLGFGLFD